MIIDDDPVLVMVMEKIMARSGFHAAPLSFDNGQSGIDFLRADYDPQTDYVIFLDINMPIMNGWQFLQELGDFAQPANTLVFVVSSSTDRQDMETAKKDRFVVKYLTKPVLSDTFIATKAIVDEKLSAMPRS